MKPALERVRPQERRKPQWREVTGVVLQSEVCCDGEYFEPIVKYEYEVDGVKYQGDSIVKGLVAVNWASPADRWVKRFPVGATVPVFVDPQDPRKCFLQLGWDPYFPFAAIFVGAIVGIFIFVLAF